MINLIKHFIKSFLDKNGYKLIRKYYHDFESDKSIKKIINYYKKSKTNNNFDDLIIFDVGANVGQSVDRFRKYSKICKIFSFEPNSDVYKILKKKETSDKFLKTFNFGLGDKVEDRKFYEQPDSGASSFLKYAMGEIHNLSFTQEALKNHNKTTLKKEIPFNHETSAAIMTINSILKENNIDHIDIIKIDTQGYEENILKGASDILNRTLIIEAEVMFGNSYIGQSSFDGILSYLRQFGFIVWDIPYIGKFATETVNRINFVDVIFVNHNLLNKK